MLRKSECIALLCLVGVIGAGPTSEPARRCRDFIPSLLDPVVSTVTPVGAAMCEFGAVQIGLPMPHYTVDG